ncbi:unnamed protein product [Lymnaea stagnalis]|uniref:Uncharacterized protein n=1 Tax=Lymnaea stagnalis TaxID=6523 RepID=A0AAV2IPY6_LYMST
MAMSTFEAEGHIERIAIKTICAAEILKNTVQSAETLTKLKKKADYYLQQASLILTWKRSTGALKLVGAAAKTFGAVMVLAAPLHPKLAMAIRLGHKMWKFGTGLKVLNAVGGILKNIWQTGCRTALIEFTQGASQLTRNMGIFSEVIHDLQKLTGPLNTGDIQASENWINILRQFIPPHQHGYAAHVINIVFGIQRYSPVFDFLALSTDPSNESGIIHLMREIESVNFTDFVEHDNSKALVAIGSFLHISREILDLLDGLQRFTERDCRFLQECLIRFTQESLTIMKVVSVLTNLDAIRRQECSEFNIQQDNVASLYSFRDRGENVSPEEGTSSVPVFVEEDQIRNANEVIQFNLSKTVSVTPNDLTLAPNIEDMQLDTEAFNETAEAVVTEMNNFVPADPIDPVNLNLDDSAASESILTPASTDQQMKLFEKSKMLVAQSCLSLSFAVSKGAALMTSVVRRNHQVLPSSSSQFLPENESANRI